MKLNFEYGHGLITAELPENTDVFIPGETVPDPPCLPQDMDSLMNITRKSVQNPIGMLPISKLVHKESKVTIVIPDIVKGGCQPTSHGTIHQYPCLPSYMAEVYRSVPDQLMQPQDRNYYS